MILVDTTDRSCPHVEAKIKEFIKYYAFEDALYVADLYYSKLKTQEALTVYADCLYRAGRLQEVHGLLCPLTNLQPRLRYILAKSYYEMNRPDECVAALIDPITGELHESLARSDVSPYARTLLSTLMCDSGEVPKALAQAHLAVEESELTWSVVKQYIVYGGRNVEQRLDRLRKKIKGQINVDVTTEDDTVSTHTDDTMSVGSISDDIGPVKTRRSARVAASPRKSNTKTPEKKLTSTTASSSTRTAGIISSQRKSTRLNEIESRRVSSRQPSTRMLFGSDTENAGSRGAATPRTRGSTTVGASPSMASATAERMLSRAAARESKTVTKSPTIRKREVKLPLTSKNSNLARTIMNTSASRTRPVPEEESSENRLEIENLNNQIEEKPYVDETVRIEDFELTKTTTKKKSKVVYSEVYRAITDIFICYASLEEAMSSFNWEEAQRLIQRLEYLVPMDSTLVYYARAHYYFERNEYELARDLLKGAHVLNPDRVEGMELLSTALWHLQDSQELSSLAQRLTSRARERPQSWCVAGNCFSLQRQHLQAVECLERALQIDPRFAYAHALLGHELVVQDELEKAAASFRSAIRLAPHDYRSWHGLGLVHLKKEQLGLAEMNMTKAVNINPTSRAMLCTLSQVVQSLGKPAMAMQLVDKALEINADDIACRFHRARLLFEEKRNEECLVELERLKEKSPDESFIYHLMAKVHRRLGNTHLALLNYSHAAEMDPRGEQGMPGSSTDSNIREEYEDDEYSTP